MKELRKFSLEKRRGLEETPESYSRLQGASSWKIAQACLGAGDVLGAELRLRQTLLCFLYSEKICKTTFHWPQMP